MNIDQKHWVLAVADFRSKTLPPLMTFNLRPFITLGFSLGSTHEASLEVILSYLDSKHKAMKGSKLKLGVQDCKLSTAGVYLFNIHSLHQEAPYVVTSRITIE